MMRNPCSTVSDRWLPGLALFAGIATTLSVAQGAESTPSEISFNRDVRPILSEHCFACHGPDEGQRKAGLRLDIEEEALKALKSGERAIVPGNPEASELVRRIGTTDADDQMPPPEFGKPLSADQINQLQAWIGSGAQWQGHWAYITPERPEVPSARSDASDWAVNEIDQFIQAKLDRLNLKPSPEAPKAKLIRRASLDLTGLPPTVEEIDAFLADESEEAYESLVDRLLASKHYGERQAMYWLDLARYGETQGFHHDRHRDMWHWRDWVIQAYNDNKPFDQFTIEQLAGDLLPNPTKDQLVATGFHRNEMTTSEGGALPEEYSVKYVVGRVDTTARVWLGTSLACAECHDHKYDPISQKDYYRFFAYFNNVPEDGLDRGVNPRPRVSLSSKDQDRKLAELEQEYEAMKLAHANVVNPPNADHDTAQSTWTREHQDQALAAWETLTPIEASATNGSTLAWDEDQTISATGALPDKDSYTIRFHTTATNITGIRLEAIPDSDSESGKSGRADNGDFVLTRFEVTTRPQASASAVAAKATPRFTQWRAVGPFQPESGKPGSADHPYGPESNLDFNARYGAKEHGWSEPKDQLAAQHETIQDQSGVVYYAGEVSLPHKTSAVFSLGDTEAVSVWLNWQRILPTENSAQSSPEYKLPLQAGTNRILLRVDLDQPLPSPLVPTLNDESQILKAAKFKTAAASFQRSRYDIGGTLDSKIETGWSVWGNGDQGKQTEYAWFQPEAPLGHSGGTLVEATLHFQSPLKQRLLSRLRLAITTDTDLTTFLKLPQNIRTELVRNHRDKDHSVPRSVQVYYRENFVETAKQLKKLLDTKRKERDNYRNNLPVAMVMGERDQMKDTFVLIRGEYNNPGDRVQAGVPKALFPSKNEDQENRLSLAQWLVDPEHPLTSRVIVNHYWQQFFGNGIVKTSEDFGSQGEWPSHPELLDWLAREFVESGWDIKHMHRLILTSATYRQDSVVSEPLLKLDPDNRLLARFPRLRLEAEGIRDMAMSVSGLLDPAIGGESIYPYQPPGLWEQVAFQGTRKWQQSEGIKNYRRGLYVYWRRSVPYASFVTFDAPSRETCTVKRPRTNTPLQALVLMNDPVYVEAARAFGLRIMKEGGDTLDDRLQFAFRLALSRVPTPAELAELRLAYTTELEHFEANRPAANQLIHVGASTPPLEMDICELAAWTLVGNILLNLDETITKG